MVRDSTQPCLIQIRQNQVWNLQEELDRFHHDETTQWAANNHVRQAQLSLNNSFLKTDRSSLSITSLHVVLCACAFFRNILEVVAALKEMETEELSEIVYKNTLRVFCPDEVWHYINKIQANN